MLRIERSDYRRSREAELLGGLRSHDPLALAEAYHRTSPAAHACARRLLGNTPDAEALLEAVYAQLWSAPPETARLEGWVRSRCFRLGSDHLRERGQAPASPSLALLLPDLPAYEGVTRDPAEDVLAALPEDDRRAVLLAHDQGLPTAAQDGPDPAGALDRGLMALAGPGEGAEEGSGQACADLAGMADWTLGLLEADRAARVARAVVDRRACASRSRALRRGRRRLEGLPAAPDLGQRVLASVLGDLVDAPPVPGHRAPPPAEPDRDPPAGPARPSAQPVSSLQQPLSSLGGAPGSPIPVAPLPSALDDTPAAEGTMDLDAPGGPAVEAHRVPADTDLDDTDLDDTDLDGTDDTGLGAAADAGPLGSAAPTDAAPTDHTEDLTPLLADQALPAADDVEADPASASPDTQVLPQTDERRAQRADAHARSGPAEAKPARGQRSVVRALLNAVAILVVLAAGAGLGLLIGTLLVGN